MRTMVLEYLPTFTPKIAQSFFQAPCFASGIPSLPMTDPCMYVCNINGNIYHQCTPNVSIYTIRLDPLGWCETANLAAFMTKPPCTELLPPAICLIRGRQGGRGCTRHVLCPWELDTHSVSYLILFHLIVSSWATPLKNIRLRQLKRFQTQLLWTNQKMMFQSIKQKSFQKPQ